METRIFRDGTVFLAIPKATALELYTRATSTCFTANVTPSQNTHTQSSATTETLDLKLGS